MYNFSQNIKAHVETQKEFNNTDEIKENVNIVNSENTESIQQQENASNNKKQDNKETWQLMIPKLDLIATIQEGVEQNIIKQSIGHFPETSMWEGNIGLAAHNRGVRSNFFENIKQLIKGDIIIYQKGSEQKQYTVETVSIILENDWSYLQNTTDNRITLITCVINQPNYRLCVQGVEF